MGACLSDNVGLQAELQAAHKESEFVRQKLKLLQEEIHTYKQKNIELVNDVQRKTGNYYILDTVVYISNLIIHVCR